MAWYVMSRFQRTALQFAQWGLGFGALAWALYDVDFALLWQAARSYSLAAMLPVFFFALADYLFMGKRLAVLLPEDIGFRHSLSATVLGTGMNCILPAKAGDALKILYLTSSTRYSLVDISSVIIWDRLLDCICLGTLLVFAWTQIGTSEMSMSFVVPLAAFAAGCCCLLAMRHWSGFFHSLYARFLPGSLSSPVSRLHASLIDQVSLPWVAHGFVYSVATWGTYYLSFYFTVRYVGGLELGAAEQLVVLTVATVGTAIPSLPGGIGLFEGAMVLSMSWYGIDGTTAMGLALFFHAVHFFPLALAALCIHSRASYVRDKKEPGTGTGEKPGEESRL